MHLLHLDEPLLEINITPDRGYAFSYRGVSREYHHSTGAAYTDRHVTERRPGTCGLPDRHPVDIEVEISTITIRFTAGARCDGYCARTVKGLECQRPRKATGCVAAWPALACAPSPWLWMSPTM